MHNEPIRLPSWLASLLAVILLPALSAVLTGVDWKTVLVGVIAAVIPLLSVSETVRAFVDSPATTIVKQENLTNAIVTVKALPVVDLNNLQVQDAK